MVIGFGEATAAMMLKATQTRFVLALVLGFEATTNGPPKLFFSFQELVVKK